MDSSIANPSDLQQQQDKEQSKKVCRDLILSLPKEKGWILDNLFNYKGTWLYPNAVLKLMLVEQHFKPQPTDIIIATFPKSGTTWFKSLVFTLVNRDVFDFSSHPLLSKSPHDCVPFLGDTIIVDQNLDNLPSPRIFATHIPFSVLPSSSLPNKPRIVYVFRDPKDVLVSTWHFTKKLRPEHLPPLTLEVAFNLFCKGVSNYGPYWDNVLGYWKASLDLPDNVLFLMYKNVMNEPFQNVKRLAEFLGKPFSSEEERDGVVEKVIQLCSFDNLTSLEVNKNGVQHMTPVLSVRNSYFFRKGEVGDWKNHLTPEMARELDRITKEKFVDANLMFET